jgi:hypothetical protein
LSPNWYERYSGKQQSPIQHDHPNAIHAYRSSFVLVKWILIANEEKEKKKNKKKKKKKKQRNADQCRFHRRIDYNAHVCTHWDLFREKRNLIIITFSVPPPPHPRPRLIIIHRPMLLSSRINNMMFADYSILLFFISLIK